MKALLLASGIALILTSISPLYSSKLNTGNIFGVLFGAYLVANGAFYANAKAFYQTKIGITILAFICIFMLVFCTTLLAIITNSKAKAKNAKTVIVLGCRVLGTKPSRALTGRCKAAYDYLLENENAIAILSGGQGSDESISEAQCMKNILTNLGIDESRLILESKSTNTNENIKLSKEIIQQNNLSNSIAIVSSEYHILRAKMIAKSHNLKVEGISCKSYRFLRVPYFFREVFGIWFLTAKKITAKK